MIASAHVAAGIAIGVASTRLTTHPAMRIVLAFVSGVVVHLLMDSLPHSDYNSLGGSWLFAVVAAEFILVLGIAAYLLKRNMQPGWRGPLVAGVIGSALPDAKFVAPFLLPSHYAQLVARAGNELHGPFHASADWPVAGLAVEVLCTALLLASLKVLSVRGEYRSAT